MTLLYPIFIYLMLPVTLILFYFIMTGSKESFAMFDKEVLQRLRSENKSLGRTARNTLFLMAFFFMILALSQPVIKDGEIVVEAKSADILIGIDISDSMMAEDRYPNRLDFAKSKAIELIKQAPHNRIGVLAFAKHDYIVSPLSFDHSSVAFLLSKVQTKNITEKGTRLDSMLRSAISMLEHADIKNLLLFTDGGDADDFSKEIELAKENGLRLFIIGVGSDKGSPVRNSDGSFIKQNGNILISKLNSKISDLATQTGGIYIESVLGEEDIKTMLNEIESITQKSTLKKETIPQYIQLFYYPLGMAVFFLFLAFSSLPRPAVKIFILFALLGAFQEETQAGLLDFKKLQEAKEAYTNEDYKKSSSLYEDFAIESPQAVYNLANSLYKEKDYERALKIYSKVAKDNTELKTKALHNSGNAHVQLKQYEEALHAYEEALKITDDKETKENYEAVKKFLQEQKNQENEQNDENQQDSKDNQDSEKNKDSKDNSSSDKDKKSNDKHEDDSKSDDQQKSEQQKAEDDLNENEQKADPSTDQMKDKNQKETETSEQKSAEDLSQEDRADTNTTDSQKDDGIKDAQDKVSVGMKEMSDLEAKKWLKAIQQSQKGHLYKMQDREHDEDDNEKPW